jgi:hypothetical protein
MNWKFFHLLFSPLSLFFPSVTTDSTSLFWTSHFLSAKLSRLCDSISCKGNCLILFQFCGIRIVLHVTASTKVPIGSPSERSFFFCISMLYQKIIISFFGSFLSIFNFLRKELRRSDKGSKKEKNKTLCWRIRVHAILWWKKNVSISPIETMRKENLNEK